MGTVVCHFAITVRVRGELSADQVDAVAAAVERSLAAQLIVAKAQLTRRGLDGAEVQGLIPPAADGYEQPTFVPELAGYVLPSYNDGGKRVIIPTTFVPLTPGSPVYGLPSDFVAEVSPTGAVLKWRSCQITLRVLDPLPGAKRLFAYELVRPLFRQRLYPIIRIVAAPGVRIETTGFPSGWYTPSYENPIIEVYRVQDPALVPSQGSSINPALYSGADTSFLEGTPLALFPPIDVIRRPDGVDFVHKSGLVFSVTAPYLHPFARFAYEVIPGVPYAGSNLRYTPTVIKLVITPYVKVVLRGATRGQVILDPVIELYQVGRIEDVPAQGTPIKPIGRRLDEYPAEAELSLEQTLAIASFEAVISLIPVVGVLYNLAEATYGIATGRDFWGRPLNEMDVTLMGLGAVLPLVHAAGPIIARAARLGKAVRSIEAAEGLIRGAEGLSDLERAHVERWKGLITTGKAIPEAEHAAVLAVLSKVDAAASSEARTGLRTVDELFNEARTGFTDPELEAAFQRYRATVAEPASVEEWVRLTRGGPRQRLIQLAGPEFLSQGEAAVRLEGPLNLANIPRPTNLTSDAIQLASSTLEGNKDRLFARLGRLEVAGGEVNGGHFRILKGNIAEILSGDIQHAVLADIQAAHSDATLFKGIRAQVVQPNGKLGAPVLFTDNIVASPRKAGLQIHAVFEVKSGAGGGSEVASQMFEWVEKHLDEEFILHLPDGTTYRYGTGEVVGLARAPRHAILPAGVSLPGARSGLGSTALRVPHSLSLSADDISYLARLILERGR